MLQGIVDCRVRRRSPWVLDLPGRAAPEVRGDGREQPPAAAAAAGAARRAVRPQRQGPGRQPQHLQHHARSASRRRGTSTKRCACWRRSPASTRRMLKETVNRRRARSELPADRADRERDASSRSSRCGAPLRAARASTAQEVPARTYPASDMAAHLFGYVGEINDAQLQKAEYPGVEPGTIVGQAGVEQAYNKLLMGADGDTTRRRQQRRPRDPRAREDRTRPRARRLQLTIDADVQKAAEDALQRVGVQRRRGRPRPAQRRGPRLHEPAGLRSERLRRRHRSRDLGVAQHRRAAAAAEPRAAGPLFARLDLQDGGRPGRARGRRHHARVPRVLRRRRDLLRPLVRLLEEARARHRSTCATRSSSRATSTSTPSATCSASTGSTSGRRCSASA